MALIMKRIVSLLVLSTLVSVAISAVPSSLHDCAVAAAVVVALSAFALVRLKRVVGKNIPKQDDRKDDVSRKF